MNAAIAIPAVLSLIVLAAHFLRAPNMLLAGICLLAPLLLLWRQAWAVRIVQVLLLIGALEWVRTLIQRIGEYERAGRDWRRMVIILGAVALVTFAAMLLLFWFKPRSRG
jgi:hypothetical protein